MNAQTRLSTRLRERYGPWAIVTGASDGIGQAFARRLAESGISLVMVARRRDRLETLATELRADHHVQVLVLPLDLGQEIAIDQLEAATAELDIGLVVAAAGYGTSGPLIGASRQVELDMIDVNCRAVAAIAHNFGRHLALRKRGGLVLMSSLLGFQGVPRAANYAATKAYVQTLAEGLRRELAPHGVDVIASAPGPIRSGFEARSNMRMSMAQTPEVVANATLRALGNRTTVHPGWLAKLLNALLAPLPRHGRSLILTSVMASMTRHQNDNPTEALKESA